VFEDAALGCRRSSPEEIWGTVFFLAEFSILLVSHLDEFIFFRVFILPDFILAEFLLIFRIVKG